MNEDTGLLLGLGAAFVLGCITGGCQVNASNEKAAIEHGAAHFDAQTGDFTWNDETPAP